MLILTRKVGESLVIGDNIEVTITEVWGDKVKIGINAPKEIMVLRKELCQTMDENRHAAQVVSDDVLRLLAQKFNAQPRPPMNREV